MAAICVFCASSTSIDPAYVTLAADVGEELARRGHALVSGGGDAFLTLPGGLGTLEELAEVWVARFLGLHSKPVVVLDVDGLYAPLRAQLELMLERGFARPAAAQALVWTTTVADALDAVEAGLAAPVRMRPSWAEELESEP